MAQRDHYEVLGVGKHSTPEEIKSAFKRLVGRWHPDRHPNDPEAHERFKEITLAYQVLSDDGRRQMYDRFGHRAEEPGSPFGQGGPFPGGFVDISDISVDGLLGDLLGVFGVGRGEKGDVKRTLEVDFEEAAFGCEKKLSYEHVVACEACRGSGAAAGTVPETCSACVGRGRVRFQQGLFPIAVERTCSRCHGTGRSVRDPCRSCRGSGLVSATDSITVTLPAGTEEGATRLVSGAGSKARTDKPPGDLEISVQVRPHPFFKRVGEDVVCAVPITFTSAVLGGEVEVPTLDGKGKLRVPAGTQPGTVLRIKGKGIPRRAGLGRGDQRVEVNIEVPTELTERQRALIEELQKELGDEVQPLRRTFMGKLRDIFG